MPYKFCDVILVRFPFTNQAAAKQRPAVVVSSDAYNTGKPDIVIMAITSQLRPTLTLVELAIGHWQSANLLKPSAIKPVFATIEQALVIRRLGHLHPQDEAALRLAISEVLG